MGKKRADVEFGPDFIRAFDQLLIINLPDRADRRAEIAEAFAAIGLTLPHPQIAFFEATRPVTAEGFPSAGARGCFLSHLAVLKYARDCGLERVLIAEDDLDFHILGRAAKDIVEPLDTQHWDIFYGGYHFPERFQPDGTGVVDIGSRYSVTGAHLYALPKATFAPLIAWLERVLAGPAPRPHVDVSISDFRGSLPDCVSLVVSPAIGIQRRSRSDIQVLRFYDRIPSLRPVANLLRIFAGRRKS